MTGLESKKRIYLDNAATTPIREEVKQYMLEVMNGPFGNPSSTHQFGRKAKSVVEEARKYISKTLGCTGNEIVFTSGGTEADNAALTLAVRDCGVKRIITSKMEHHAVLHTAEAMAKNFGVELVFVNLLDKGVVDLNHLEELLKEGTPTLVSLMHGNNEVGNLLDLKTVGTMCRAHNAYFHTDTVQTMAHCDLDLSELPIDFLAASAHKFYGPKGVGFMYVNHRVKCHSFISGGSQERNMRGGTENVLGIAGLHKAFQLSIENMEAENAHITDLKQYMIDQLKAEVTDVRFNGLSDQLDKSLLTVLSCSLPCLPKDGMYLFTLDMNGVMVSGGSACTSGSQKGSHVIEAIDPDNQCAIIRFSFGKNNTREELDYVIETLKNMMVPVPA
ncbi:cysteine desulfurase family protein [Owenweeksia hongkongensis]|uniref:cysteine desulfurase family protein n=1 Tax=Owenweeksia hongkongensis TaxID=253245 RepID=UPI003A909F5D